MTLPAMSDLVASGATAMFAANVLSSAVQASISGVHLVDAAYWTVHIFRSSQVLLLIAAVSVGQAG